MLIIFFNAIDAPVVIIDPPQSPYNVNVGDRLFLYCKALGYPIPTVQWYKGRRRRPAVSIHSIFQQLVSVETNVAGSFVYTCIGRNIVGKVHRAKSKSITVVVNGKNLNVYKIFVPHMYRHLCSVRLKILIFRIQTVICLAENRVSKSCRTMVVLNRNLTIVVMHNMAIMGL